MTRPACPLLLLLDLPEPCARAHHRAALERVPFLRNWNTLSVLSLAHVLVGEPATTSPEHARGTTLPGCSNRLRRRIREAIERGMKLAGRGTRASPARRRRARSIARTEAGVCARRGGRSRGRGRLCGARRIARCCSPISRRSWRSRGPGRPPARRCRERRAGRGARVADIAGIGDARAAARLQRHEIAGRGAGAERAIGIDLRGRIGPCSEKCRSRARRRWRRSRR